MIKQLLVLCTPYQLLRLLVPSPSSQLCHNLSLFAPKFSRDGECLTRWNVFRDPEGRQRSGRFTPSHCPTGLLTLYYVHFNVRIV